MAAQQRLQFASTSGCDKRESIAVFIIFATRKINRSEATFHKSNSLRIATPVPSPQSIRFLKNDVAVESTGSTMIILKVVIRS